MSRTPIFTKLFGPSPIAPIQQHMSTCEQCAIELMPFFDAVIAGDWQGAEAHAGRIGELEGQADEIKKNIRMSLPRSLFLPVSRNNLLEIIHVQDRIANTSKDIAGLIMGRKMQFPVPVVPLLNEFTKVSTNAVSLAREAMDELNDLIITGFSDQEIEFIEEILDRLHRAEHESDLRQVEVRRTLFAQEQGLNPVNVVFIYKVIDRIGDVADDAQAVGNRMMYLIAS